MSAVNRIHYLCNAGVMLESGGKKVLIDGLINHDHRFFNKYSPQLESKIIKGEAPFDNLDLVLVTHFHDDHFDRRIMADFCRQHPRTPVAGSPQVMDLLRPELQPGAALAELNPGRYEYSRLKLNGVDLTAVSLLHAGREYENDINLAYVLHLGKTFTHTGDAVNSRRNIEALLSAGAGKRPAPDANASGPDASGAGVSAQSEGTAPVIIAPFPYLTLPLAFKKFCGLLEPECLFIMHLPNEDRDTGGWIEATHKALDKQRDSGPRIILAKREGDVFSV